MDEAQRLARALVQGLYADTFVLWDFDLTLTKKKKYADLDPFSVGYASNFCAEFKGHVPLTPHEVMVWMRRTYADIRLHPDQFGWPRDGRIVCSASDVLIKVGIVGNQILDHFNILTEERAERDRVLDQIYRDSYSFAEHELRPEAPMVLNTLWNAGVGMAVMTNSDPAKVRKIIAEASAQLAPADSIAWLLPLVHGFAQKAVVTPGDPPEMPETLQLEGLSRPCLLQRGHAIATARKAIGERSRVFAVDDLPELCLLWAEELGYTPVLVANDETPEYERRRYRDQRPRRYLLEDDLTELPAIILNR